MFGLSKSASTDRRMRRQLWLRVTLPIAVAGTLPLAIGGYAAWGVYRLHSRGVEILNVNVANIRAAEALTHGLQRIRYLVRQANLPHDRAFLVKASTLLRRLEPQSRRFVPLASDNEERALAHGIEGGFRRVAASLDNIEKNAAVDEASFEELSDEIIPSAVIAPLNQYVELNEQQIQHSSERIERTSRQLISGLLLLAIAGGLAGIIFGYGLARAIGRRLVQLSFPVHDVAGKLSQAIGPLTLSFDPRVESLEEVLQQISERVTTVVEQLQRTQRDALRAEKFAALGQLAAGLSHELRNPLTSIMALLDSCDVGDLTQEDLAVLREESMRLEQLVQSLLDFAKPNEPQFIIEDVCELIQRVVSLLAPRAAQRGLTITCNLPDTEIVAAVDVSQFRQILLNLLLNSIDAARKSVQVRAYTANSSLFVVVQDDGAGIPAELGERIFEPFVSSKETGIGLGLSISRRLAEFHGGTLIAVNHPNGGSTFIVELPAASHDTSQLQMAEAAT